jgi:predicted AAA+ superfamily ATPase
LEFGKRHYGNVVYLVFENNERLREIFGADCDVNRIITGLEAFSRQTISKENTLIIFDEIQACEAALTSLKYFCENAREYHIACAGSLLGLAVNRGKYSFPVGKVDLLHMYPMNFEEFLTEVNPYMIPLIRKSYESDSQFALHEQALELYRTYLVVGGMPEVVSKYIETKDFDYTKVKQFSIFETYIADMAKYATGAEYLRHKETYNSIPYQLAKENKKFQFNLIQSGARSKNYADSLLWLQAANIVLQCTKVREGKHPLAFYADALSYKIYMSDVGLLTAKSEYSPASIIADINLGGEAKGALCENYVAQELTANGHALYYWESQGTAEVDFILQKDGKVIPAETKAAEHVKAKSLNQFVKKYDIEYSIRISAKNFGFENNIKSVPLYAVFCI